MKTTTATKSMSTLSCDLSDCPEKFHTASVTGKTRGQAKTQGWTRVSLGRALKHHGIPVDEACDKFRGGASRRPLSGTCTARAHTWAGEG